ncbi:MAG: hypothetical protein RJQ21_12495 [Rhodospirillales bacterium]
MKLTNLAAALTLLITTACVQHTVQKKPTVDPATGLQSVSAFGHRVVFPPAVWVKGSDDGAESEYFSSGDSRFALWEQIPKGQSFDSWQQMYAVQIVPAENGTAIASKLLLDTTSVFIGSCRPGGFESVRLSGSPTEGTFLFICENVSGLNRFGYRDGMGEVAIFRFVGTGTAAFKIYHEWRGPKFRFLDRDSWPVSREAVEEAKKLIGSVSFDIVHE